uniref:Uncharacterized protein n=1 Tax=Glossina pallidipes TaxID=7398 RepID=A0A1B0A7F5_GLOPL
MIRKCMTAVTEEEWKQLPLQTLLYEWARRNLTTPSDILSYMGLFLITWYTIIWITRLILGLIRPLFLVVSAIVKVLNLGQSWNYQSCFGTKYERKELIPEEISEMRKQTSKFRFSITFEK